MHQIPPDTPPTQKVVSLVLSDPSRGIVRLSLFEMFFEWGPHAQQQPEAKVLVVLEGAPIVHLENLNERIALQPYHAVLIPHDEPHTFGVTTGDRRMRGLILRIAELPPNDLYRHLTQPHQPRTWQCDRVTLRRTVRTLRVLASRSAPVPPEALMQAAWGLLVPHPDETTTSSVDRLAYHLDADAGLDRRVVYVETRMQQSLARPYDAAALAESIQVSVSQMNRLFNRYRGLSPMRRFQQLRLEQARQYLVYSTLSIKQIARRCGFTDPDHFGRLFRQHTGQTPRAYRATHQLGKN